MFSKLAFLLVFLGFAATAGDRSCAVCGMTVKENAKIGYSAEHAGKKMVFCSFDCASRFHAKYPKEALKSFVFGAPGDEVESGKAFYLVKSKKMSKDVEFGMPPVVGAFKDKASAEKYGDGEIVSGFDSVQKALK